MSDTGTTDQPAGLRERKKAKTRATIREHALPLFRDQGYDATTVEQIAAAAEVSPARFYRYFPTKRTSFCRMTWTCWPWGSWKRCPPASARWRRYARQPPGPSPGSPSKTASGWFWVTTGLTMAVPEIWARALDEFARTLDVFATALGQADRPGTR